MICSAVDHGKVEAPTRPRSPRIVFWLAVSYISLAATVHAQEFTQVQSLTSRVLFAKEDQAAQQREAERLRIEELDHRAQLQAALLMQQAASVQQLSDQVRQFRDEKAVTEAAAEFDAAILAGNAAMVRVYLADTVSIALAAPPATLSADNAITMPPLSSATGRVLPRSHQQVRIDGDRAVIVANGYGWNDGRGINRTANQPLGTWTYELARTPAGWKIAGIAFALIAR